MIFDSDGTTTLVFQEDCSKAQFLANFMEGYPKIKKDHLIVNLLSFSDVVTSDVLAFLEISKGHRKRKKSFVLVTEKVSYDEVPEEICVVPTIQEAKDLIEMEEIERDLGF